MATTTLPFTFKKHADDRIFMCDREIGPNGTPYGCGKPTTHHHDGIWGNGKHSWTCTECRKTRMISKGPEDFPILNATHLEPVREFVVSQDTEVILDGCKYLLEKGDKIIINEVIKKVKGGYKVLSHKKGKNGKRKNLGGPYKSKAEAHKRLGQVEYFKNKKK